jgi:hypothetical protein
MTCERVTLPGGFSAIVCSSRKRDRCKCGRPATLLCDWKTPKGKTPTCDSPICKHCATNVGPDKDLCPNHAEAFERWKASR